MAASLPSTKPSVPGIPDTFVSWLKQTEGEAAHSPSYSDDVDNEWRYTSVTHVFVTLCLVKHGDNFTNIAAISNLCILLSG